MELHISDKFWRINLLKTIFFVWICVNFYSAEAIDITCTSNSPRIAINSTDDLYLSAYLGENDTGTSVTFDLQAITGTSFVYPGTSVTEDTLAGYAARHSLPADSGSARVGAFKCQAVQDGVTDNIVIIILSQHADILPISHTLTASIGDSIILEATSNSDPIPKLDWRKNGITIDGQANNQLKLTITSATTSDAGIYEIYENKRRDAGQGAITRLIVRDCPAAKWNPPSCDSDCQVCYNGGVCDDQTGICICAPGFSGTNCQNVHGRNHFGQDGSQQCTSGGDPHDNGCQGQLFCLPDPYGCSCAAGYTGIDCVEECSEGTYGADCKGTCHCADGGAVCLKDTGECETGGCEAGWQGVNCQVPVPCPESYIGELCQLKCNCLDTQTCVVESGMTKCYSCNSAATSAPTDIISASLSTTSVMFTWNPVQCSGTGVDLDLYEYRLTITNGIGEVVTGETNVTEVTITGLTPCTQYTFSVGAKTSVGAVYSSELELTTSSEVPDGISGLRIEPSNPANLHITWNPPSSGTLCPATHYMVRHTLANRDMCMQGDISSNITVVGMSVVLEGLAPHSTYMIALWGVNEAGSGRELEFAYGTGQSVPSSPPDNVQSTSVSSESVSFSWDGVPCGSRGGVVRGYTYKLVNSDTLEEQTGNTGALTATISGLMACTVYNFSVAGRTNEGAGPYSEGLQVITGAVVPDGISGLKIEPSNPANLHITWNPPSSGTLCPASHYMVKYTLANRDMCMSTDISANITVVDMSVLIEGLAPHSTYMIALWGVNEAGSGRELEFAYGTGQSVPLSPPDNVQSTSVSSESVSFSWDGVPCGSRGGVVRGYTYKLVNSDTLEEQTGNTGALTATISGLMACTVYNFSVAGKTNEGTGPYSEGLEVVTDALAPSDAPLPVSVIGTTPTSIDIAWTQFIPACDSPSADVQAYHYMVVNVADPSDMYTGDVTAPSTSVTVSGLNSCVEYSVMLAYSNVVGKGPYNEGVVVRTNFTVPSTVRRLNFPNHIDATNPVVISWEPPSSSCPATSYIIDLITNLLDSCEMSNVIVTMETTNTSVVLTNLSDFSSYQLTITTANSAGRGRSIPVLFSTAEAVPKFAPDNIRMTSATTTGFSIDWDPIPCGRRGGDIKKYLYKVIEPLEGAIIKQGETSMTSATLDGLLACMTYGVKIAAMTNSGVGPFSEVHNASTSDASVPSLVNSLAVTGQSNTTLLVTWQAPSIGCVVNEYVVTYTLTNRDQCQTEDNVTEMIVSHETLELMLSDLWPYSNYTVSVRGRNDEGDGPEESTVWQTLGGAPIAAPLNIYTISATTSSLTLTWGDVPCGSRLSAIQSYQYALQNIANASDVHMGAIHHNVITINGLDCDQVYEFRLAAVSEYGVGPQSDSLAVQTKLAVPAGVTDLTVTGESSTELRLSWQPPDTFCIATSYLVQYKLTSVDHCNSLTIDRVDYGVMFQTFVTISGLIPYSNYTVYVTARNDAGDSPSVTSFGVTLERAPVGGPSNLNLIASTPDSLSFTWDEPLCGNRGGQITHYMYNLVNPLTFDIVVVMQTTNSSATITGLEPCTMFTFSVNAYNSIGSGPGEALSAETAVIAPSPVQNLLSIPQPSGEDVDLSWEPPLGTCQPNIYRVEYQLTNEDQCLPMDGRRFTSGVTPGTSHTVGGLRPYSTYALLVIGINVGGEGLEEQVVTTTAQSVPTSPSLNISTHNLGNLDMLISWQPPPCGHRNGPITSYNYKLTAQSDQAEITGNTTGLEVVVSNLTLLEEYSVVVSAATIVGSGPFSIPVLQMVEEFTDTTPAPPTVAPTQSSNLTTTVPVNMTTQSTNVTDAPGNTTSPSGNATVAPPDVTTPSMNATDGPENMTSPSGNVTVAPPVTDGPVNMTSPSGNATVVPPVTDGSANMTSPSGNVTVAPPVTDAPSNMTTPSVNVTVAPPDVTTPSMNVTDGPSNMTSPSGNVTVAPPVTDAPSNMTTPSVNVTVAPPDVTTPSMNVTDGPSNMTSPSGNVTVAPPVTDAPSNMTSPSGNVTVAPPVTDAPSNMTSPSGNVTVAPPVTDEPSNMTSPSGNVTVAPPEVTTPSINVTDGPSNMTSPSGNVTAAPPVVTVPGGNVSTIATPDVTSPEGTNVTTQTPVATTGMTSGAPSPEGTNGTTQTPIATTSMTSGAPSPDGTTGTTAGPPSPEGTTGMTAGPPSPEGTTGTTAGPPSPEGTTGTTAGPPSPEGTTGTTAGAPSPEGTTGFARDPMPSGLALVNKTQTMLRFKWGPPVDVDKEVQAYTVNYRAISKPYDNNFQPGDLISHASGLPDASCTDCQTRIDGLEPSTQYEVQVTATIDSLYTNVASLQAFTSVASGFKSPIAPELNIDKSTKTLVAIGLPRAESKFVSGFQVGVIKSQTRNKRANTPVFGSYSDSPNAYVAGEVSRSDDEFSVGDGGKYGGYENPPLTEGQEYDIYVAVFSRTPDEEPSIVWGEPLSVTAGQYKPRNAPATSDGGFFTTTWIAVICGIAVLIIIIIVIFIFVVSQHCKKKKESQSIMFENGRPNRALDAFPVDESDLDSKPVTSIISLKPIDNGVQPHALESPVMSTFSSLPRQANGSNGSHANGTHANGSHANGSHLNASFVEDDPPTPGLIAVRDLPLYIEKKKAEPRKGFDLEYKMLPGGKQHAWNDSMKVDNQSKNRYSNIVPYDHSRVKLQQIDDNPHSDYINACYINNYKQEKRYIASQGPKDNTIGDFWRMIWEHKANKVVMLTNCVESGKIKCALYWPDLARGQTEKFGTITVIPVSLEEYLDYTVRTFHISKLGDEIVHAVKQFHFTSWPDMGVPQYPTQLLNFRKAIRDYDANSSTVTIVHCSAGVGRSGAYIAIDTILDQAVEHGGVDIYKFVSDMRQQRCKMVQTSDQYQFIYQATLEGVLTKETAIPAANFEKEYAAMNDGPSNTLSSLDEQFQLLGYLTTKPNIRNCKAATRKENMDKNRFNDRLPSDHVRPFLVTPAPIPSTDYINAALIPGFRKKNQYISTQMPLPHTMTDIWRLVYDYKATTIVMLNVMDPNDQTYGRYWPEQGSNIYGGNLAVDFESSSKISESVMVRTYKVYNINSQAVPSDMRTVQQYQFLDWYDQKGIPAESHDALLSLVTMVDQWQKKSGGGPIIVQCLDGVGCSGVYCALSTILQRLEESLIVDVFQTVKGLRMVRPNMVETPTQYQFLYEAVQHHISQAGPSAL